MHIKWAGWGANKIFTKICPDLNFLSLNHLNCEHDITDNQCLSRDYFPCFRQNLTMGNNLHLQHRKNNVQLQHWKNKCVLWDRINLVLLTSSTCLRPAPPFDLSPPPNFHQKIVSSGSLNTDVTFDIFHFKWHGQAGNRTPPFFQ